MKPPAEHMIAETYPHQAKVRARFSDMDAMGHLNNVAIGRFYEEARVIFNQTAAGALRRGDARLLVAEVCIQYLREGYYPDDLLVCTGILKIGRSSYVYGQALFQKGKCIGTAQTTQVFSGPQGAVEIPAAFRDLLEANLVASALAPSS